MLAALNANEQERPQLILSFVQERSSSNESRPTNPNKPTATPHSTVCAEESAWGRSRLIIVGSARAGKTSVLRSLMGEQFVAEHISTVLADQLNCDATVHTNVCNFTRAVRKEADEKEYFVQELAHGLMFEDHSTSTQPFQRQNLSIVPVLQNLGAQTKKFPHTGRLRRSNSETSLQQRAPSKVKRSRSIPRKFVLRQNSDALRRGAAFSKRSSEATEPLNELERQQIAKLLKQLKDSSVVSNIIFSVWDCGGQRLFEPVLHLFLTKLAVYMVAFDMQQILSEAEHPLQPQPNIDGLRSWLNSIHLFAAGAPILLIGTRKDIVDKQSDHLNINRLIQSILCGQPFAKVVQHGYRPALADSLLFFPINNRLSGRDDAIVQLRSRIEAVAKTRAHIKRRVPIGWIKLHHKLDEIARKRKPPQELWVPRSQIVDMARECGMPSKPLKLEISLLLSHNAQHSHLDQTAIDELLLEKEVDMMLQMFCEHGTVVHFNQGDLAHMVIIDPKWLLKIIRIVIRDHSIHKMAEDATFALQHGDRWSRYTTTGVIDRILLHDMWKDHSPIVDDLIGLMERYGLLVRLRPNTSTHTQPDTFLIPALLRPQIPDSVATQPIACCFISFSHISSPIHADLLSSVVAMRLGEWCSSSVPVGAIYSRLLGRAVEWCQFSGGQAVLGQSVSRVCFGSMQFELSLSKTMPLIEVKLWINAISVVWRLHQMLSEIQQEWMPALHFHLLAPVDEDGTSDGQNPIVISLSEMKKLTWWPKQSDNTLTVFNKQSKTFLTADEIVRLEQRWFPFSVASSLHHSQSPNEANGHLYDFFISYRQESDSEVAKQLHDNLIMATGVTGGRSARVFIDELGLADAKNFREEFLIAMSRSRVVVPLVSAGALKGIATRLERGEKVDNMLLEWLFAVELQRHHLIRVLPVVYGDMKNPKTSFVTRKASQVTDFFKDNSVQLAPEIPIDCVVSKLSQFLREHNVDIEINPTEMPTTAKGVVQKLLECKGRLPLELGWDVFERCSRKLVEVLNEELAQAAEDTALSQLVESATVNDLLQALRYRVQNPGKHFTATPLEGSTRLCSLTVDALLNCLHTNMLEHRKSLSSPSTFQFLMEAGINATEAAVYSKRLAAAGHDTTTALRRLQVDDFVKTFQITQLDAIKIKRACAN